MDATLLRTVMGRFATGVTVLTFLSEGRPSGMTANAFMSVSMNPPLVLISIRRESQVNHFMGEGVRFGINVLAESQIELCRHFAGRAPGTEVPFIYQDDVPLLAGSLAHLAVRAVNVVEAGDHLLYISAVEYVRLGTQRKPLVFFTGGYRQVQAYTPVINWASEADCS
jgi:flavin reductase (DIM6/NTAB) family NADH-FMN oxidoreductase RutF